MGGEFEAKLKRLIELGADKLQILVDFDRTITSLWRGYHLLLMALIGSYRAAYFGPKGGLGNSCHGILESGCPAEVRERAAALNQKYYREWPVLCV